MELILMVFVAVVKVYIFFLVLGGKTRNEIYEALDIIYPILRSYRKS